MRAILILVGVLLMSWPDDMRAVSAAIDNTRRQAPPTVPYAPPPRLKNEPTFREMIEQSRELQMIEEELKRRPPPPQPDLPYGNRFLTPNNKKYRIDENAPYKNPWSN